MGRPSEPFCQDDSGSETAEILPLHRPAQLPATRDPTESDAKIELNTFLLILVMLGWLAILISALSS